MQKEITIKFDDGRQRKALFEDSIYSDRTSGQYDSGGLYYVEGSEDDWPVFVSFTGIVYKYGTGNSIGVCKEIQDIHERELAQEMRDYMAYGIEGAPDYGE